MLRENADRSLHYISDEQTWTSIAAHFIGYAVLVTAALALFRLGWGPLGKKACFTHAGLGSLTGLTLCITWEFYLKKKDRGRSMDAFYDKRAGYYRMCLGENDVCFATRLEKSSIPEEHRELYPPPLGTIVLVGKAHPVLEDRFWVWREDCKHADSPMSSGPEDDLLS